MVDRFSPNALWMYSALGLLVFFMLATPIDAYAQVEGGKPEFIESTQQWLDHAVANIRPEGGVSLRMDVTVGELDRRLRLAPCVRIEPYIPVGTRLWGKSRLGIRCLDGSVRWNVFLPVTVKAYGPAWVIKGDVAAGATLMLDDAIEAEVDWAQESSPIVTNPSQWVGLVASRALTTGQALRQSMVRPAQVFQAGAQVRVIAQGVGFQIASDGQALSAGIVGQPVRVRMDNGRVMMGIVLDGRTVKLDL
jgi:flagella basal body P-ring formation protein FlgA